MSKWWAVEHLDGHGQWIGPDPITRIGTFIGADNVQEAIDGLFDLVSIWDCEGIDDPLEYQRVRPATAEEAAGCDERQRLSEANDDS